MWGTPKNEMKANHKVNDKAINDSFTGHLCFGTNMQLEESNVKIQRNCNPKSKLTFKLSDLNKEKIFANLLH